MSSRERGRFPSVVRERDLPKPLRRARGAVMAAKGYEHRGIYVPVKLNVIRNQWVRTCVGAAADEWARAVAQLLTWGLS